MHLVFVYGTLKRKHYNHYILVADSTEYIGVGVTYPKYDLISLGYFPAAIKNGDCRIQGEIYKVDDDTLQLLDQLEGNGNLYLRELISLENYPGKVWVYLFLKNMGLSEDEHIRFDKDKMIKIWD